MEWIVAVSVVILFAAIVTLPIMTGLAQARLNKSKGLSIIDYGTINKKLVCPHCQTTGKVFTKQVAKKVGISGGKATGAILTGGISLLATGLSHEETVTELYCGNCSSTWSF